MARVLIIGPDIRFRIKLTSALMRAGFSVRYATDEGQARELAANWHPDLTLLGPVNLDRLARQSGSLRRDLKAPLIAIGSPSDGTDALVAVLNAGADDYLSTATNPEEVIARVRAILRWRLKAMEEADHPETSPSPELNVTAAEDPGEMGAFAPQRSRAKGSGGKPDPRSAADDMGEDRAARRQPRRTASLAGRFVARIAARDLVHH